MNVVFGMASDGLVIILDKFGINVPLLTIQMINFLLVAYLLYRFAFRDVIKSMDKRNREIQDGLKYSEKMKAEWADIENKRSNILTAANSEASEIVNEAQKSATDLLAREKEASKELAQNVVAKARADIKNEHDEMFNNLKGELKEIVIQAAEQVLARELSDSERMKYREQAVNILVQHC